MLWKLSMANSLLRHMQPAPTPAVSPLVNANAATTSCNQGKARPFLRRIFSDGCSMGIKNIFHAGSGGIMYG